MNNNATARDRVDPLGGAPAPEPGALKRALTGLAGASIEWYDFFLYATAAALVFPTLFFPSTLPPFVALIASFSTFAVGFLARPVGAVLFGHLGDRRGRKLALATALIGMGVATTLIGCLPTYRTAGVFSPLALVLLRIVQGLAIGGQWGGAILLATEGAPKSKRGLYGSIAQAGVPVGSLLANSALLIASVSTSSEGFMAFAWRVPFLFSILLIGLGLFIQFRIEDTLAFRRLRQSPGQPSSPVLEALRLYPKSILLAAGAFLSTNLSFYILTTYAVAYGTSAEGLHMARSTWLTSTLTAGITVTPVLFLAGTLSDRFGRRRLFMTGLALMFGWSFVFFPLIDTRSPVWIVVALMGGLAMQNLAYGPLAALFAELFSTRVRYSATSLAYQIAAIVGGGLAPIIATSLHARFHSNFGVAVYVAGACAISLVCVSRLKETRQVNLDEADGEASPGRA